MTISGEISDATKIPLLPSGSPVAPPAAHELFTQKTPFLTVLMDKGVLKGGSAGMQLLLSLLGEQEKGDQHPI